MPNLTIVVDCNDQNYAREICEALRLFPDVTAVLPEHPAARTAEYASCWFPDTSLLTRSPALKLIRAASAGVDHLPDNLFASSVPLCRVVDEDFRHGMFEYALWGVLWFQRSFRPRAGASTPAGLEDLSAAGRQRFSHWRDGTWRNRRLYRHPPRRAGVSRFWLGAQRNNSPASGAITAMRRPVNFLLSWMR